MRREEIELCKMAMERGWLTSEELDLATREQEQTSETTLGPPRRNRSLGVVLVAKGFLTDAQLQELREALKTKGIRPIGDRSLLGQILVNDKVVPRILVDEALAKQAELLSAGGRRRRVGEILVDLHAVTPERVIAALRKQRKEILECAGCNARFNVLDYATSERYPCPKCGSTLRVGTMLLDVDDTTIGIKPADAVELPPLVAAQPGPKVHFGKFIVMRELFRSSEGPVHMGWQKDRERFVALQFVAKEPPAGYAGRIFTQLKREAQSHGIALSGFLEAGTYEGRRYVCWSLTESL